ncbi:MAG: Mrp/NBP35 family ATP-binding protein [Spirochaetota bacterium]
MITEEQLKKELVKIKHPDNKRDIVSLGMLGSIHLEEGKSKVVIVTPAADRKLQINLEAQIRQLVSKLIPGKLKINFIVDPNLQLVEENKIPGVKRTIAIGSGKGGVGKSTVTANLAVQLAKAGYKVGVMDSDIYGPSLGKMFGINGRVALQSDEERIWPVEKYGLKVISFSFLIDENQPVVWRGPMLGKAVEQFLYDVVWDELDYLLIDLPPGTGDVQLSLSQLIHLDGAVIVTTPQNVAILDASKAASMFQQVKIPILGIIENMSEFICPNCGTSTPIFSSGGGENLSNSVQAPLLGQVPLTVEIMNAGDVGNPIVNTDKVPAVNAAYQAIIQNLESEIKKWD